MNHEENKTSRSDKPVPGGVGGGGIIERIFELWPEGMSTPSSVQSMLPSH